MGSGLFVRNISPPPGFDPQTVQPVDSRYTDYAILPQIIVTFVVSHSLKFKYPPRWGNVVLLNFLGKASPLYSNLINKVIIYRVQHYFKYQFE